MTIYIYRESTDLVQDRRVFYQNLRKLVIVFWDFDKIQGVESWIWIGEHIH